ncbi:MAG: hypothetical protein WBL21_08945 [Salinimicrobium sp.]
MRKLILCMFLLGIITTGHTQILLKEANVFSDAASLKLDPYSNSLTIHIPETRVGEFGEDPLMFLKNHFNVNNFVQANKDLNFSSYQVWFKTKKGYMVAELDKEGKLLYSVQKFRNIILPQETRKGIRAKYPNAVIVQNKYVATTNGWDLNRKFYMVKIKDGNKVKRLHLEAPQSNALAGL